MTLSKSIAAASLLASLVLAGCQSERFASVDTRTPEPLPAAPSGTVTSNALPPPAAPGTTDPTQFPTAPGTTPGAPGTMAAAPTAVAPPPTAPDLTASSVAGVWNASVSGQSCKVATPQTKFGSGFRAGPLRCPAPLDGVKSWNVAGKQLTLYDESGSTLARLYSSAEGRFDGQTESGVPVSLSR